MLPTSIGPNPSTSAAADAPRPSNSRGTLLETGLQSSSTPAVAASLSHDLAPIWNGAWTLETWTPPVILRLFLASVVLTLCSWLGIILSHQSEGVATMWLSNGILFGLVITRPREQWIGYFAIGLLADTVADVLYGDPFRVSIGVSVANSVEVVTSCLILTRWFGAPLNLSRRRPLIGFLLVSVGAAAALTSAIGATWTLLFIPGGPWWQLFRTWYLGDMLGMALLAPLVFMLQRPGFFSILHRSELAHTLLVLLIAAASTVLVFTHDQDPLIFFLFPALILVVFRLGFPGTVLTIFLMAFLSIGLTIKGHGPLMLIPGEHMLLRRIVVAQIFLAVAIFTAFPVAALLEERESLQLSLAESEARHRRLANADDLTGLSNRRAFNLLLEQEWHSAMQAGNTLALLLLDADLFKKYNDVYGHLGGDECLRCIASAITGAITAATGLDLANAARFGGEEFAIILPGRTLDEAERIAEDIRRAVFDMALPHPCTPAGVQTVSLGVAALTPRPGEHVMELVTIADRALYRAKDLGRNRTVVA